MADFWSAFVKKKKMLGKGGFGKVYRCKVKHDVAKRLFKLKKPLPDYVAVKQLFKKKLDTRSLEKLDYEIEAINKISPSDYTVEYFTTFQDGDNVFIVMQLLDNYIELQKLIQEYEIPLANKHYLVKQLVKGMLYLHSKKFVHRDVKPGNIMVSPETLDIRYVDYGFSCFIPKGKNNPNCSKDRGTSTYRDYRIMEFYEKGTDNIETKAFQEAMMLSDWWSLALVIVYTYTSFYDDVTFSSNMSAEINKYFGTYNPNDERAHKDGSIAQESKIMVYALGAVKAPTKVIELVKAVRQRKPLSVVQREARVLVK